MPIRVEHKYNLSQIQQLIDAGCTALVISKKLNIPEISIYKLNKRKAIKLRTRAEALKLYYSKNPYRKHSEKTKALISKRRKEFLEKNPDKVPYLLNHYSKKLSYAERYFKRLLRNSQYTHHFRVKTYQLDFANIVTKLNLEIDGEQHHSDSKIVLHDIKRNQTLQSAGWSIIRLRWSLYCKQSREQREIIVKSILEENKIQSDCLTYY